MPLSGYVPKSLRIPSPSNVQSFIDGGDESSWSTILDIVKAINAGNPGPLHFLITRGWTGYSDDQQYTKTANLLKDVVVKDASGSPLGALLWGSYMYLGYGPGSRDGQGQAANFWGLINAGGSHYWQIMPAVDVEREPYVANGVTNYYPLPPLESYLDNKLMPAINYIEAMYGRLPLVYSNLDLILHYLKPAYGNPKYAKLFKCPLWLAIYSSTVPKANIVAPMWDQWAIWQDRGDVHDREGISDIDYNEWPGNRAEFKAFITDPNAPIPAYVPFNQTSSSTPPPEPTTETWATVVNTNYLKIRTAPDSLTEVNRIGTAIKAKSFKVTGKKTTGNINWVRVNEAWLAVNVGSDIYLTLEDRPIQK